MRMMHKIYLLASTFKTPLHIILELKEVKSQNSVLFFRDKRKDVRSENGGRKIRGLVKEIILHGKGEGAKCTARTNSHSQTTANTERQHFSTQRNTAAHC